MQCCFNVNIIGHKHSDTNFNKMNGNFLFTLLVNCANNKPYICTIETEYCQDISINVLAMFAASN